jgi:hypothetical protein
VLIAPAARRPRWSPSTRELFYVADRRLEAVSYAAEGDVFRAGTAATLFDLGPLGDVFEVAPGGKRFLFVAPIAEDWRRDAIRVVTDGFEVLRGEAAKE